MSKNRCEILPFCHPIHCHRRPVFSPSDSERGCCHIGSGSADGIFQTREDVSGLPGRRHVALISRE